MLSFLPPDFLIFEFHEDRESSLPRDSLCIANLIRWSLTIKSESANLQSDIAPAGLFAYTPCTYSSCGDALYGLRLVSRKPRPYINSVIAGVFARASDQEERKREGDRGGSLLSSLWQNDFTRREESSERGNFTVAFVLRIVCMYSFVSLYPDLDAYTRVRVSRTPNDLGFPRGGADMRTRTPRVSHVFGYCSCCSLWLRALTSASGVK